MRKSFTLPKSNLASLLKQSLGENFAKAKAMWTISPYDYPGDVITSKKERLNPGRDCTCSVLVKFGTGNYAYIFIYHKDSGKQTLVIPAKGYPKQVIVPTRHGKPDRHAVYRSQLK